MIRDATVPLDSYRLAQYATQVPCYICDGPNSFDAEYCRHCHAPMAIAHQAATQKQTPQLIATLGPSGSGKTVYLGMLIDMLSREAADLQLLARGAFSITLQQRTVASLAHCEFPDKTPNEPDHWNWVHVQVSAKQQKKPFELVMPDMAGEAILEEIEHPHTYPVIRSLLSKCAGAQILIDATDLYHGERDQDYFTMKLLSYLIELDDDAKTGWPHRPIALVFTKSDECDECFVNPTQFARSHAKGLWQHCRERFQQFQFFASGVAGSCGLRPLHIEGYRRVPLRIEPRGIVEPFQWLMNEIK